MNLEELTNLANAVNNNENVLKNKTISIRNEVRDWCIEELRKIEAEENKLLDFVNANHSVFCDHCGTPLFYSFGMCYSATGDCWSKYRHFTHLDLDKSHIRFNDFDPYFQSASVHSWTTKVQGCYDCMNGDIEYWTRMKKCIDFRRYQLAEMTKNLGRLVQSVLDGQKKRMDGVVKVCKEIDEERNAENPCVEVTISIRKSV